jgi:recombinational DNA repair protein RecT
MNDQKRAAQAFAVAVEKTAKHYLSLYHPEAAAESAGRIVLAIRQAASVDSDIYACDTESVARAVAMCVVTGLMPGGALPSVYLLPRKIKDRATGNYSLTLTWQISVRGLMELGHESGYRVRSVPVFTGDQFELEQGLRPDIRHVPNEDAEQSWATLRGVYVVAHEIGSTEPHGFEWVSKAILERLRASSDAATSSWGPWVKWPIEMARARAIGYALRRGLVPMRKAALREAAAADAPTIDVEATEVETETAEPRTGLRAALTQGSSSGIVEVEIQPEPENVPALRKTEARQEPPPPNEDDLYGMPG